MQSRRESRVGTRGPDRSTTEGVGASLYYRELGKVYTGRNLVLSQRIVSSFDHESSSPRYELPQLAGRVRCLLPPTHRPHHHRRSSAPMIRAHR
jgi:hypothetical protein